MDEFLTQCYAGLPMALTQVGQWDTNPPLIRGVMVEAMLAQYLNMCYMSLMKDNDKFVTDMFALNRNHSPVCVLHKIMGIGTSKVIPALAGAEVAGGTLDAKRAGFRAIVTSRLGAVNWEQLFNDHECSGDSAEQLRAAWAAKGRPDDDGVFVLK